MAATSARGARGVPQRHVYVDLGVNWGDTLELYRKGMVDAAHNDATNWEVYGFEASPLIQPFVDEYVAWLDGGTTSKPVLCVPPTGSSKHLALWAPRYGCPATPLDAMRACVFGALAAQLAALRPNPGACGKELGTATRTPTEACARSL